MTMGLRRVLEFDVQLQTEEDVHSGGGSAIGGADAAKWREMEALSWKGGQEGNNQDYECLRAELCRMAPPNDCTVRIFRNRCGCPIAKLEGWGTPKSKRRNKKTLLTSRKTYFSAALTSNAILIPASQSRNRKESQTSQDDTHASIFEKNEQSVPSRSNNCAISDGLAEEDSFAKKDKDDEITDIITSLQNYNGPDTLDFLRKTIGIREIRMEKIYRPDSILGDMPHKSTDRRADQ